ncbi:hypothetical protein RIF29_21531 [Crotalaria pallida]|uniref:Uncharacterized protein n=1 Tax=Crotalaria pallida TaxID=3830 RepID=A0AAN9I7A1_CROPI
MEEDKNIGGGFDLLDCKGCKLLQLEDGELCSGGGSSTAEICGASSLLEDVELDDTGEMRVRVPKRSVATIPEFILQLPNEVMSNLMGALILPMIHNLETTMKSGGVPQAPQFRPSTTTSSRSAATTTVKTSSNINSSTSSTREVNGAVQSKDKDDNSKAGGEVQKSSPNVVVGDPLGDVHGKVQDEIIKQFAAIMATGTMRASEAAALGTKRVM